MSNRSWIFLLLIFKLAMPTGFCQETLTLDIQEGDYGRLRSELQEAEKVLLQGYQILPEDIEYLRQIAGKTDETSYQDLIVHTRTLLFLGQEKLAIQELSGKQEELINLGIEEIRTGKRKDILKLTNSIGIWTTLGTGIASLGLSGLFWYLSELAERDLSSAQTLQQATELTSRYNKYHKLSYYCAGIGAFSFCISAILMASGSSN